jgi:integrase
MGKKLKKELSASDIRRITKPGMHAVGGVDGLSLRITKTGSKNWVLRVCIATKPRCLGLGGFPSVSLKHAREKARSVRELITNGIDPVQHRKNQETELLIAQAKDKTFDECAEQYMQTMLEKRSDKNREAWESTLRLYASPVIGRLPVSKIEFSNVLAVLEPIWKDKTPTAKKLRQRIEKLLDWAKVHGYREGENPARWIGNLKEALPAPGEIHKEKHRPALDWREVGGFVRQLRKRKEMAARCLEFLIMTGLRVKEVQGALWNEIDFDAAIWTVPAERMKTKVMHQVPLAPEAIALLRELPRLSDTLVFPSVQGRVLHENALRNVILEMHLAALEKGQQGFVDRKQQDEAGNPRMITAHGFRSTFRDWIAENTAYPQHVADMAIAHAIPNEVEKAYRRGDLLAKRTNLMRDWCRYLNATKQPAKVTPIRKARK